MELDERTFFVVDETCDERAFLVIVVDVVVFDSLNALRTHIRFYLFEIFLNHAYFIRFEGSASVASNTTFTFASREMTTKTSIDELVSDYYIINYYHKKSLLKFIMN